MIRGLFGLAGLHAWVLRALVSWGQPAWAQVTGGSFGGSSWSSGSSGSSGGGSSSSTSGSSTTTTSSGSGGSSPSSDSGDGGGGAIFILVVLFLLVKALAWAFATHPLLGLAAFVGEGLAFYRLFSGRRWLYHLSRRTTAEPLKDAPPEMEVSEDFEPRLHQSARSHLLAACTLLASGVGLVYLSVTLLLARPSLLSPRWAGTLGGIALVLGLPWIVSSRYLWKAGMAVRRAATTRGRDVTHLVTMAHSVTMALRILTMGLILLALTVGALAALVLE